MEILSVLLVFLCPLMSVCANSKYPVDCKEVQKHETDRGKKHLESTVYPIYPLGQEKSEVKVYCDMETEGGGWTVIQSRMDGSVNFYRPWTQYKLGFGDPAGEYWLGLDNMHYLTNAQKYELFVSMEDFDGNKASAKYSTFTVGPECDGYTLYVSGFKDGGAKDALAYHNGYNFTTFDKDLDGAAINCAKKHLGGFWYRYCHQCNPNGLYLYGADATHFAAGVEWSSWKGHNYSLKTIVMKIRPLSTP